MPQKTFLNSNDSNSNNGDSFMKTAFKTFLILILLAGFAGSFAAGWYTSNKGFRVVDSGGASVVKSNAAQIVKDENSRLGRDVIGKSEAEAEELLKANSRTFFVGIRDGKTIEYKGQKTFTNLTVEVKNGFVVKIIGWY